MDKIDAALDRLGKTRYWLAKRIGKAPSRLTQWADGQGEPGMILARKIAEEIDVPLDWLCDDSSVEPPPPARSEDERLLLDAVRPIGPRRALQLLMWAASKQAEGAPTTASPVRSVEVRAEPQPTKRGRRIKSK